MPSIEIDFEVFKALTARRVSETVTENDVIRQLLGLGMPKTPAPSASNPAPGDWIVQGVRLPEGTELRAHYKGKTYMARVSGRGLELQGRNFGSVSAAAMSLTKTPVNGWKFWEYRFAGEPAWRALDGLRRRR